VGVHCWKAAGQRLVAAGNQLATHVAVDSIMSWVRGRRLAKRLRLHAVCEGRLLLLLCLLVWLCCVQLLIGTPQPGEGSQSAANQPPATCSGFALRGEPAGAG
jgi:hypothetical protein